MVKRYCWGAAGRVETEGTLELSGQQPSLLDEFQVSEPCLTKKRGSKLKALL